MSVQYNKYLEEHKRNVVKAYEWFENHIPDVVKGTTRYDVEFAHDHSKYSAEEYSAYDAYFYGNNHSVQVVQDFIRAWLHHIHANPHHWQYWVLINDDPDLGDTVLEMDYSYVIEMICDWWSFGHRTGKLHEIFEWYAKHKDHIRLHPKTRELVEDILHKMRSALDSAA